MILYQLFPYLVLLLLTVVIPKFFQKTDIKILFVIFVVFGGCCYGVGWDYYNYTNAILSRGWFVERMEFFPRQLAILAGDLNSPQLFFFVNSFVVVLLYFFTIQKKSINPAISILVFLCLPIFFLSSINILRYAAAMAVLFFAHRYAEERHWLLYLGFVVIAFFTHKASIFGVLVMPFFFKKVKIPLLLNIAIFVVCFVFSQVSSFSTYLSSIFTYLGNWSGGLEELSDYGQRYIEGSTGRGFSRTPYIYAFINVLNFVNYHKLTNNNTNEQVSRYITLFNIGCSVMFLMSFDSVFGSRMAQPFLAFALLLIPYYFKNKNDVYCYVISAVLVFVFVFQLSIPGYHSDFIGRHNCYLPYRLFFFQ